MLHLPRDVGIVKVVHVHEDILVVVGIHDPGQCQLFVVVETGGAQRLLFGLGQRRQQQRRQDGNDGDDHQQLDEGEGQPAVLLNRPPKSSFLS